MTAPRVGVVVLAAGRSTRFGHGAHKLLTTIGDVPLVRLSVRAAVDAGVGEVVVVTGAKAAAVEQALDGLPVRVVREPAFADGMALSLRRGVVALARDVDAILISLGDQPSMRPDAYREVASRWSASRSPIVVPRYADGTGPAHPVLFAAEIFAELLALEGDTGARSTITRDPSRVAEAALPWPAPRDVDTPEDLELLLTEGIARERATADSSAPGSDSVGSRPSTNTTS
jgi:molybdenum cofactor cytidylyltransferase